MTSIQWSGAYAGATAAGYAGNVPGNTYAYNYTYRCEGNHNREGLNTKVDAMVGPRRPFLQISKWGVWCSAMRAGRPVPTSG